jgi:1,6-anhydro-N-acetylmuramate kinase
MHSPRSGSRFIVGCMSGTSIDAIDAALVRIDDSGLSLRASPLAFATRPLDALVEPLRRLTNQAPMTAGEISRLAHEFSRAHIQAIRDAAGTTPLSLIAVHGQTIFHAPPLSWQLLAPASIAAAFGAPVVYDLRAADLAAGGQGAPITPIADFILFASPDERRTIVNLGGFANYTALPAAPPGPGALAAIRGGDICVCNQLLDTIARECLGVPFDQDGRAASEGVADAQLLDYLVAILDAQARAGRSLGTGDELLADLRQRSQRLRPADVARTACDAIVRIIVSRLNDPQRILLAGGGARNCALLSALRTAAAVPVQLTDDHGVPAAAREAIAMAILGALCHDGVPITLPQITSVPAPAPVSGAWTLPRHV